MFMESELDSMPPLPFHSQCLPVEGQRKSCGKGWCLSIFYEDRLKLGFASADDGRKVATP